MRKAVVVFGVMAIVAFAVPALAQSNGAAYTISPRSGPAGTEIRFSGTGCRPGEFGGGDHDGIFAFVTNPQGNFSGQRQATFNSNPDGSFSGTIRVPNRPVGSYATGVSCEDGTADGGAGWPHNPSYQRFRITEEAAGQRFRDVPANHTHARGIEWLVSQGITQGCAARLFCPDGSVTRGQMATFLQRALDLPAGSVAQFSDVPANHIHARGIGAVARAGITTGCRADRFCPEETVSRAQMASFLQRALNLPSGSVAQFRDVPANHVHARGIGAVARADITRGCTATLYCPADAVSRGQMATFLMRALR